MRTFFALSLLIVVSFTAFAQETQFSIAALPKGLSKNANSVLLDEKIEIDITQNDRRIFKNYRAVMVLNKKGNSKVDAYAHYDDDAKVKDIEAWVYDAMGNELEHFKKRDFKDISASDGISIYNDDRVLYLDYTPTTYPYTLVFESVTQSNTTAHIPSWFPLGGYATATKNSEFTVKFHPTNKPRILKKNLEGFDISVSETPEAFICSAKNLKAVQYEEYSPSYRAILPHVKFALNNFYLKGVPGHGKDWKEFGAWMDRTLLSDVSDLSPATIARAKQLVAGETTHIGKAKKIYEYLQNKVRYISVQIGIGGWKPMLAEDVDKLSYGDCKALTNYTKALLDVVGVPSYYTVLYAGDEEVDLEPNFAGIQGNHVILGVPDGEDIIWLECTSQDTPFGYGGNFSDDRDVLIVTPEGGKIVHTKAYTFKENVEQRSATIKITPSGAVQADFKGTYTGLAYDDKYRLSNLDADDLEKQYKNRWAHINGFTITKKALDNNRDNIQFTETLSLDMPSYCSSIGNDLLFGLNVFSQTVTVPPRFSNRKQKLKIAEGFTERDSLTINIHEALSIDSLPEAVSIENKFGSYSFSVTEISENTIQYKRTFILKKGVFPATDYKKYRAFLRTVSKLDQSKILLKQNT
ncbi:DUF3857 domain-containing protein [Marixanthomonas spongiae]|uniref:DUF3857 domain-containing protein n=1 Tax=Marixanthomonas spongiae TaxID=2174845 RepID=A0A2U0I7P2_9FLAO|nr:DUF3857 domain-containing protein [Marixanthomonas spongiae]PVW17094.1 DUF3857 domain-containing protein [Marixanthomonas spongiae]